MISYQLASTIRLGVKSLLLHKLRSALTMLGIIIGVAAVITMIAVGSGATQRVQEQMKGLGSNIMLVLPGSVTAGGVRLGAQTGQGLTEDDATAIARDVPEVQVAAPNLRTGAQVVVGNTNNKFGKRMVKKFGNDKRIVFAGPIYDPELTHTLKYNCPLYFHGHTVGGTNPSLIEAMASQVMIAAHDNHFNRAVLDGNGYYFNSAKEVRQLIETKHPEVREETMTRNNFLKIKNSYNWPLIVEQYETFIRACYADYHS